MISGKTTYIKTVSLCGIGSFVEAPAIYLARLINSSLHKLTQQTGVFQEKDAPF
jgi:hypothetical protein